MASRRYRYGVLAAATGNFAESQRIGRGGFDAVYWGFLDDDGGKEYREAAEKERSAAQRGARARSNNGAAGGTATASWPPRRATSRRAGGSAVAGSARSTGTSWATTARARAVKALSLESSAQGRKEFEAEVKIISRPRHRNLVQLLGWCDSRRGLLLVYELVPGGNLDEHLHSPDRLLSWTERFKIALDLGSALCYLHTRLDQCVVHGDIKPSNGMLDASLAAKLGDFGLARLLDHGAEPQTTGVVAGTVGYIDPEFVSSRRPTTASDVYSFGVVLLEIACGRQPTTLLRRVRDMYERGAVLDAADRRLNGEFEGRQMERVLVTGLWCAHRDSSRRPSIVQAMSELWSVDAELRVPIPGAATHGDGSGQIRFLEERAYGDLSMEMSENGSMRSFATTAYHTPPDSSYLLPEE